MDLALTITPAFTNKVKTSPPQKETLAQSTVSPGQLKPLSVQQEVSNQPPTASEKMNFLWSSMSNQLSLQRTPTMLLLKLLVENEVTVSPLGPVLPHITAKSVDLAVALTPGPTKELEHSQCSWSAAPLRSPWGIKHWPGHQLSLQFPRGLNCISQAPQGGGVFSQQVLQTQTSEPPAKVEPLSPSGTLPHLLQPLRM